MARKRVVSGDGKKKAQVALTFTEPTEKQRLFNEATTFFVAYGGARAGGKSHAARQKAVGMAHFYPGIRILMVRAHYPELEENLINPIRRWVPSELYSYNGSSHLMTFTNGSIIKFGHWDGDGAEDEYQGLEFDVIFIDEATQLSERAFKYLTSCVRGVNDFPKRMYITCNPGGVGHRWVKRLFIDKQYKTNCADPEENEDPADYTFIFATLDDNPYIRKSAPMYAKQLASLPPDLKAAHRYGDWNALSGSYFKNFSDQNIHQPFKIPGDWPIYRSFDYGLDMFAVGWWTVDTDGRCWCFRYFEESGLVIEDAAKKAAENTLPTENVLCTYAPPDMWAKSKETGKGMNELFNQYGLPVVKTSNNRVQGHMIMKDMLSPIPLKDPFVRSLYGANAPDTLPGLMFFDTCEKVIEDIKDIQADEKNLNDCAKMPHDVTHSVDMCRYFCISRVAAAETEVPAAPVYEDEEPEQDYESWMCGGEITDVYMSA